MRHLIILITVCYCQMVFGQEQITSIQTPTHQFLKDWIYEDDQGNNYYIQIDRFTNYNIHKLEGNEYKRISNFTSNFLSTHIEINHSKLTYKNFLFHPKKYYFQIIDMTNGEEHFFFNTFPFVDGNIIDYDIINDKIYFTTSEGGIILDLISLELTPIKFPEQTFLGRILDKYYFINNSLGNVYLYNDEDTDLELIHDGENQINLTKTFTSGYGESYLISEIDGPLIKIDYLGYSTTYSCNLENILNIDHYNSILVGDKILMYEKSPQVKKIIIYDLNTCTISLEENLNVASVLGTFIAHPKMGEDFVIFDFDNTFDNADLLKVLINPITNKLTIINTNAKTFNAESLIGNNNVIYITGSKNDDIQSWDNIIKFDKNNHTFQEIEIPHNSQRTIKFSNKTDGANIQLIATNFALFTEFYSYNLAEDIATKQEYNIEGIEFSGLQPQIYLTDAVDNIITFKNFNKQYVYQDKTKIIETSFDSGPAVRLTEDELTFAYRVNAKNKVLKYYFDSQSSNLRETDFSNYRLINHKVLVGNFSNTPSLPYYSLESDEIMEIETNGINGTPQALYVTDNMVLVILFSNEKLHFLAHNINTNETKQIFEEYESAFSFRGFNDGLLLGLQSSTRTSFFFIDKNFEIETLTQSESLTAPVASYTKNIKHGSLLSVSENDEALLVSGNEGNKKFHFIQSERFPKFFHAEDLVFIKVFIGNDFYTYLYDFTRPPIFLYDSKGLKLEFAFKENENIILFYENTDSLIEVYKLNAHEELEYINTHSDIRLANFSQSTITKIDSNYLLLSNVSSDQYGNELHKYNIKDNSFEVLQDINPNGDSNPDNFKLTETALFFTAESSLNNRQWYQLDLKKQSNLNTKTLDFDIFPTLATTHIKSRNNLDKLSIYNVDGQLIIDINDYEEYSTIPTNEFSPGTYFVVGKKDGETATKKFVKQ